MKEGENILPFGSHLLYTGNAYTHEQYENCKLQIPKFQIINYLKLPPWDFELIAAEIRVK